MLSLVNHPDSIRWQEVKAARDDPGLRLGPHQLSLVGRSTQLAAAPRTRTLRNVSVIDIAYGAEVVATPHSTETFILVHISFTGTAVIRAGAEQIHLRPAWVTALDLTKATRMRLSADHTARVVRMQRGSLEAQLRDMLGHPLTERLEFGLGMDAAGSRTFTEDVAVFTQRLETSPEAYESDFAATMTEKNLMTQLLLSTNHNYRSRLTGDAQPEPSMLVRRSIELMHGHPGRDHSLESLARGAGVSARTLERAFQRHKSISPMAYLKTVRLDRAHEDLRAATSDVVSVGDVARRWGFANRGRFAADYRERHGELPSETLRR